MASDLSQDAVLHFLRGGGGSVKNADLLLHFRGFIRDHADRDRNREQFKKYVNTVATVQQLDGVSYVVLKRKFRGRAPGGRGEGGPGGARREPSPGNVRESPVMSAEKPRQKPQHLEVTTTAPPGQPASKTILPAAGIMMNNNNNVEASFNLQQQQEVNKQELHGGRTPRRPQPPPPDQSSKMGQTTGSIGPPYHGTTLVVGAHGETRQQIPIHEPFRGRETEIRTSHFTGPPAQEWTTRVGQQKVGFGPGMGHEFYAVRSHGETRHQVLIPGPPTREAHNFSEPAAPHRSPNLGQHMGGYRPPQSGITYGMTRQQRPIQEALRGREAGLINPIFSEPPGPNRSPKLGQHMMGFAPHDPTIYEETRQQIPIQGPLRGWEAEQMTPNFSGYPAPDWSPKLGQHKVGFAPHHPGIAGEPRQQIPVQEPHRAQEPELRDPGVSELPAPNQSPKQGQHEMGHGSKAHRMAPKVAAVRSNEEPRLHIPVQESELRDPSPPSQDQSPKKGQHNAGFGPSPSRQIPVNAEAHRDKRLETSIQEPIRGQEPKLRDQSSSGPPAQDQSPKFGQHKMGLTPLAPETTPEAPSVKPREEIIPDLETLRRTKAEVLNQEPPSPAQANPNTQVRRRRHRHRKSYKSAISCDEEEEEEEEEEEVTVRCGSAGEWPVNRPLGNMAKAISTSSPCIIDVPSVSVSSMDKLPQIFVQDVGQQTTPPRGNRSWSSESGEELRGQRLMPESSRHSLPLEAEHHVAHTDRRLSQPPVVHLQQSSGVELNQRSTSSIYSPSSDSGLSMRDWPMSSSPGGSGWSSSLEDLHSRTDKMRSDSQMQGALQRAKQSRVESSALHSKLQATRHHSTGNLHDDHEPGAPLSPLYHSNEHLHGNQLTAPQVMPKNLSTGDLHDDHQQAGLSKDSPTTPTLRHPSGVPRRLSSHLRNRMCLSMGADLDQLMQEEERVEGGSEAARLNRLHLLSSSLSLRYNLSSSSLSSCSTPPRSQSLANLTEAVGGREGRKSLLSTTTTSSATEGSGRQSQVPLESREHDWLVKGAAGAWPDIYTLFREDSTLLNRRDFISGFTVLHWIAKHGDHRVLNTLWYGVQKAGLTFDINARSSSGHTPLHIAAIHGHKNIMRLLVSKFKADVKLRDTAGKRAWQYLSRTSTPEIFQLLGTPPRAALGGGGGAIVRAESTWTQERQHPRRRRRHHLSSASSAERPQGISAKVKRSSSIAAFLKHKSLQYLRPSDPMV